MENKEIHIDDLSVEWAKLYKDSDLHFNQYVKKKESEGWKIIYSEERLHNERTE